MKTIKVNDINYEIIKDVNDAIVESDIIERLTDYFYDYDYLR